MYKIAVVEDDINLNNLICAYLKKEGYEVISFKNGRDVLENLLLDIDLWLLDIMLGDNISGHDIIREIKSNDKSKPVIFISARSLELDRITGLELGSEDYITKPFSPREMVLRVNRILDRVYGNKSDENIIIYSSYKIDVRKRAVYENSTLINLTSKELDLLLMVLKSNNQAFSREQILNNIWGGDYFGSDRVVDDLVRRLRKKMPKLEIETLYGFGYRLL